MIWRPTSHRRFAQLADFVATAASFVLAYALWDGLRILLGIARPIPLGRDSVFLVAGLSAVWVIIFSKLNAYSYQRFTSFLIEVKIVARATVLGVLIFFGAFFFFRFGYVSRLYIAVFALVNFALLAAEKYALVHIAGVLRRRRKTPHETIIVGTGDRAAKFVATVRSHLPWGLDIVGVVAEGADEAGTAVFEGYPVLGKVADIEDILHARPVEEVIICVSSQGFGGVRNVLECCEREGVQARLYADFFGDTAKRVRVDHVYDLPIISFLMTPAGEFRLYLKRLMDIVIAGAVLLFLSPLLLVIALLVKLTSRGPVFYRWNVIGLNKRPFSSWKFRTMVPGADDLKPRLNGSNIMKGPVFKMKMDPRVTRLGRFLRKYSLDELPQLWSVLNGDMSLVGPRPAGPDELTRYESWHRRKLSIKPGVTCLWQISGRNAITDFDDWVRLDLDYIENWSLWLDLKILLKTIPAIIKGTGY